MRFYMQRHEFKAGEYMDGGCSCGWNATPAPTVQQEMEWEAIHIDYLKDIVPLTTHIVA